MARKRLPAAGTSDALPVGFPALLGEVKLRIQSAQTRAMTAVNSELVRLYWDIGRLIDERQQAEGWGASVIPRLAFELRNELPEVKGFSERNIDRMIAFFRAYPSPADFSPPPVAKLEGTGSSPQAVAKLPAAEKMPQLAAQLADSLLWAIPWIHHVTIVGKVKDAAHRRWYMEQTLANGWSCNILTIITSQSAYRATN